MRRQVCRRVRALTRLHILAVVRPITCRVLRAQSCQHRVAIHRRRVAADTRPAHTAAEGTGATADRADTAGATTARRRADIAAAIMARRRAATAGHVGTAARRMVVLRRGDIVAEATPRRRRTAQPRSAAAADTPGHVVGVREGMAARGAPMGAVVRMVVAGRTAGTANWPYICRTSPRLLSGAMLSLANSLSCNHVHGSGCSMRDSSAHGENAGTSE
jgi:hypothetical protein